jgi:hypothetical protein
VPLVFSVQSKRQTEKTSIHLNFSMPLYHWIQINIGPENEDKADQC